MIASDSTRANLSILLEWCAHSSKWQKARPDPGIHIQSIMMDEATLLAFEHYMGNDNFYEGEMPGLTPEELAVCTALRHNKYANTRLEQEFIAQDFVQYMFEPYK